MAEDDEKDTGIDEADEAAEGEEGEGGEGGESSGGMSKKKKIIVIVAAFAMLTVVAGAAAYFTGALGGDEADHREMGDEVADANTPVYFDLPQILVNLNSADNTVSFIKTTVTLQLSTQTDVAVVEANLPRLMDSYNTFLREMRATDLYGSAGVYRLREEMLRRANKMLAPVKVKDVLFREILVQ